VGESMATEPSWVSLDLNHIMVVHSKNPWAIPAGSFPGARNLYEKMAGLFDPAIVQLAVILHQRSCPRHSLFPRNGEKEEA
jgi:hypothetical protein